MMMTEMGQGQVSIGDKSSVYAGAKVSLCAPFKRADVSRLAAKWSNSTDLTTIQTLLTTSTQRTVQCCPQFPTYFPMSCTAQESRKIPLQQPQCSVHDRKILCPCHPHPASPLPWQTLYLAYSTSSLTELFQGTRWRLPTDFWSNWSF